MGDERKCPGCSSILQAAEVEEQVHIAEKRAEEEAREERRKRAKAKEEWIKERKQVQVGESMCIIGEKIGEGGFGLVFDGRFTSENAVNKEVALKFQHRESESNEKEQPCSADTKKKESRNGTPYEWQVYRALNGILELPRLHYTCELSGGYYYMAIDKLGFNLSENPTEDHTGMIIERVKSLAIEAISILEKLHNQGYVHGDVKPQNFLLGSPDQSKLFITDLGLASRWKDSFTDQHVGYDQRLGSIRGTVWYASVHSLLGRTASRRDDLESLAYTLFFLLHSSHPWKIYDKKNFRACKLRMTLSPEELFCSCDSLKPFRQFYEYVTNLKFQEEPHYAKLKSLFQEEVETFDVPIEKSRMCLAAQWIVVYSASSRARKQRPHWNIEDGLIDRYVEKEKKDNLFISSVTSCQNLWTLIMDEGTGFGGQKHKLFRGLFNDFEVDTVTKICTKRENFKECENWIEEQTKERYYITSLAGANNGNALIVLSNGTDFIQQAYNFQESFPYDWIKGKWEEGFFVTTMATSGSKWAVVMHKCEHGTGFLKQVYEFDCTYPSEGLKLRQKEFHKITATAVTEDEVAFIFSVPRKKLRCDIPMVYPSSIFPSQQVKDYRERKFFVSSICYGGKEI